MSTRTPIPTTFIPTPVSTAADIRVASLTLPAPGFEGFTFPRYRGLLLATEQPETTQERRAVGAWLGETPVGLAFFSRAFKENTQRQLLSVMVSPLLRRQGVGTRLLAHASAMAATEGITGFLSIHSSQIPSLAAFVALLRTNGWAAPEEKEYRLAGKAAWALEALHDWAPFLTRLHRNGFGVTPWSDLSDADRVAMAWLVDSRLKEADLKFSPFNAEKHLNIEPELSILLRRKSEIAGWILGARGLAENSFYYSTGYVLPEVRRAGWLIGGVRDVCQRQAEKFGGDTIAVFETAPHNQGMRRFMERQLKPYSAWTDVRYHSEKLL